MPPEKINYPRKVFWTILTLVMGIGVSELKVITTTITDLSQHTLDLKNQLPLLMQRIRENKLEILKLKEELHK
jgi:hypothetical protein